MIINIITILVLILTILGMAMDVLPILCGYIFCLAAMVLLYRAIQKMGDIF